MSVYKFSSRLVVGFCMSLLLSLSITLGADAEILFSENFDQQNDWAPEGKNQRCPFLGYEGCSNLPANWDFFHSHEEWFLGDVGGKQPAAQISSQQRRGDSGKSFIVWDESYGSNGDWGSDGQISKSLGAEYPEVYAEFYIKFQDNYRWKSVEDGKSESLMKLFRVQHLDEGPGKSAYSFFKTGSSAPIYILDLVVYAPSAAVNYAKTRSIIRCDEQLTNYYCGDFKETQNGAPEGAPSFAKSFGDGQWHKFAVQLVMNSSPGVGDGVVRLWVDDQLLTEMLDVPFRGLDSTGVTGWNTFSIGGNAHNYPALDADMLEQWIAIDDVVVWDRKPKSKLALIPKDHITKTVNPTTK